MRNGKYVSQKHGHIRNHMYEAADKLVICRLISMCLTLLLALFLLTLFY